MENLGAYNLRVCGVEKARNLSSESRAFVFFSLDEPLNPLDMLSQPYRSNPPATPVQIAANFQWIGVMGSSDGRMHGLYGPTPVPQWVRLPCRKLICLRSVSGPGLVQDLAFMGDATTVPMFAVELPQRHMRTDIALVKACDHAFYSSLFLGRSNWSRYGPELCFYQPANYEGSYPKGYEGLATLFPLTWVRTIRSIFSTRYCRRRYDVSDPVTRHAFQQGSD